jgi:hypothetical protein
LTLLDGKAEAEGRLHHYVIADGYTQRLPALKDEQLAAMQQSMVMLKQARTTEQPVA